MPDEWQTDRITEYDPVTDTWTQIGSTPTLFYATNAALIGKRIYVSSGGYLWSNLHKTTWFGEVLDDCGDQGLRAGEADVSASTAADRSPSDSFVRERRSSPTKKK